LSGVREPAAERARNAAIDWPDLAEWPEAAALVEADAALGAERALTLLVVRHFARGLRGFAASSPGYLAAQFLDVPGRVERSDETLEVSLSRAPLGVVLRMAGYDGDRGPIPWLGNRRLVLHLPEG